MTAEDTAKLGSMLHTWDYMSADHQRLKWEIFGYARGQCPVARTEEGGGFWLWGGWCPSPAMSTMPWSVPA